MNPITQQNLNHGYDFANKFQPEVFTAKRCKFVIKLFKLGHHTHTQHLLIPINV